jgi:hypothetical protein
MFDELDAMLSLAARLEALKPPPPLRVCRSDFVPVDDWVHAGEVNYLGRFAWWRLMRSLQEPIPETSMEPDADFPRDCAP